LQRDDQQPAPIRAEVGLEEGELVRAEAADIGLAVAGRDTMSSSDEVGARFFPGVGVGAKAAWKPSSEPASAFAPGSTSLLPGACSQNSPSARSRALRSGYSEGTSLTRSPRLNASVAPGAARGARIARSPHPCRTWLRSPNTSTSSAASAGRAGARRNAKSQALPSFDHVVRRLQVRRPSARSGGHAGRLDHERGAPVADGQAIATIVARDGDALAVGQAHAGDRHLPASRRALPLVSVDDAFAIGRLRRHDRCDGE
jgi:hypothetical protein